MNLYKSPKDLAEFVRSDLQSNSNHASGPIDIPVIELQNLFDAIFAASFQNEEGRAICPEVIYIDSGWKNGNSDEGWRYFSFAKPLPLTARNLIKLALATDPKTSAIAVGKSSAGPGVILGLIDQRDLAYHLIHRGHRTRISEPCGHFQVNVEGPGQIWVYRENRLLAQLKVNQLIEGEHFNNVLREGEIVSFLNTGARAIIEQVQGRLNWGTDAKPHTTFLGKVYQNCLSTILLRMQNYHHGVPFSSHPTITLICALVTRSATTG